VKDQEIKPSVPTVPVQANKPVPPPAAPIVSKYKSEDYNGAPIVKLRVIQENTMQYDTQYKLLLDSTTPVEMPLTPFFAGRIGTTIELCV
jgi:hypothetical protein